MSETFDSLDVLSRMLQFKTACWVLSTFCQLS